MQSSTAIRVALSIGNYRQPSREMHRTQPTPFIRDLKLENILLDADDNVKICDFGFARFTQKNQYLETFCGSLSYSAPGKAQQAEIKPFVYINCFCQQRSFCEKSTLAQVILPGVTCAKRS